MMPREIRELGILDQDLDAGNASDVISIFSEVVMVPRTAKALRGSIVFKFGRFDEDSRPNFIIPEVRRFTAMVDHAHPYFCYFLIELPEAMQIYSWIMSLASPAEPLSANASGMMVKPAEFIDLVATRVRAVRALCERIYDDPRPTENAMLQAIPESLAAAVVARLSGAPPPPG